MSPLFVLALLAAAPAEAHIALLDPPPRTTSLKEGPCGDADLRKQAPTAIYAPGETITVVFDETVDHPGWFRILFDDAGQDDLPDPRDYDDTDPPPDAIQLAHVTDVGERHYEVEVTLPETACERCTLQVIQVMTDKPPYTSPGNDLYYQCADVALRGDVTHTDAGDAGDTDAVDTDAVDGAAAGCDGGCDHGGGAVGALGVLVPLALLRRRRGRSATPAS